MQKLTVVIVALGLMLTLSSCEQKSSSTKQQGTQSKTKKKVNNTGVSNVADYATGLTPLSIKKRKQDQMKRIERKYTKKYDEETK